MTKGVGSVALAMLVILAAVASALSLWATWPDVQARIAATPTPTPPTAPGATPTPSPTPDPNAPESHGMVETLIVFAFLAVVSVGFLSLVFGRE